MQFSFRVFAKRLLVLWSFFFPPHKRIEIWLANVSDAVVNESSIQVSILQYCSILLASFNLWWLLFTHEIETAFKVVEVEAIEGS